MRWTRTPGTGRPPLMTRTKTLWVCRTKKQQESVAENTIAADDADSDVATDNVDSPVTATDPPPNSDALGLHA